MTFPVYLSPTFGAGYQGFTTGGLPLNAGKLYTYQAGGTTPQATYTTSAGTVANANPIVLDADGRTPSEVWFTAGVAYRIDVKDSSDNLIKTYDNLYGIGDPGAANQPSQYFGLTSISGTNTITAASGAALSALAANQLFAFVPANTNSGATTLEITPSGGSSLGAKNVYWNGAACLGGELTQNVPVVLQYDGTQFNIIGTEQARGTTSTTFTFNGSGGTTGSKTLTYQKIGNWVTLNIPSTQGTSGTSSTSLTANTALPASFRPTNTQDVICVQITDNGNPVNVVGLVRVTTGGVVTILKDGAGSAWTNSSTCGTQSNVSITYFLG